MEYLIISHLLVNTTILFWYIRYKQERFKNIWKEVILTLLIGWLIIFMIDDNVKLRRDTAEGMIGTYEFLVWNNVSEEKKECQRILKALKKALS